MSVKTQGQIDNEARRAVSLPEPIYRALRARARMEGIPMGALIREMLRGTAR